MEWISLRTASDVLISRRPGELGDPEYAALEALASSHGGNVVAANLFLRFDETPDGRFNQRRVAAAVAEEGVVWATVPGTSGFRKKRMSASEFGIDRYDSHDIVAFNVGEFLLENAEGTSGVGFDPKWGVGDMINSSDPGYEFLIAISIAGFDGGYSQYQDLEQFKPGAQASAIEFLNNNNP